MHNSWQRRNKIAIDISGNHHVRYTEPSIRIEELKEEVLEELLRLEPNIECLWRLTTA